MIALDDWQREILEVKGNMVLCSGRQVGKSTIVACKAGEEVINNRNYTILIVSVTERQAEELFMKCLNYIQEKAPRMIKKGKDRPTKHMIRLSNGSCVRCQPTGVAGTGLRGLTINGLIVDEAAWVPDIWASVVPMLMTTGGWCWLLSTPHGKQGYFYQRYCDPTFKVFHINSEKVVMERPISASWSEAQRSGALEHLERQKRSMSKREYAQEYLGEFVDELSQYFTEELIKKSMSLKRRDVIKKDRTYFCGVDVARLGEDASTFVVVDKIDRESYEVVESIVTTKTRLNETATRILELDRLYDFKKIYIDDAGVGSGVFDFLLINDQVKRKIVSINNSARPLDRDEKHKKKILKEDLYNNLLMLMEQGFIKILDDDEIYASLKSVQYEYVLKQGEETRLRIFGKDTHIVEGLIRAAWCAKDKSLNIWCR